MPQLPSGTQILDDVIARVRAIKKSGKTPVVVFDLDHTLFDNGPRTVAILREYAVQTGDAELLARLPEAPAGILPYRVSDILAMYGETRPEVAAAALEHWTRRFFTDEWQKLDVPLPGAVDFVDEVFEAGATVVYLSGRDVPNMLLGTTESLRRFGYPVGLAHTVTVLKPNFEMKDLDFKRDVIDFLGTLGEIVASFDNEPANCNMFRRMFPKALSVFLETAMEPGGPPLDDRIPHLLTFVR